MTLPTLRLLHSEQTAVEAALTAYRELYERLMITDDERTRRVVQRAFERGSATLDRLMERASAASLSVAETDLLEMYLRSMHSDDAEQLHMWLGLLPESMERMLVCAAEAPLELAAVAEEPAVYEAGDETVSSFRYSPHERRSVREQSQRWEQPAAV